MTNYERVVQILRGSIANDCIEWWGSRNRHGYGIMTFQLRDGVQCKMSVHRFALEFSLGRNIGAGLNSCHHCDNPACFNPKHLYEGTTRQNIIDAHARGRHPCIKGEKHPMAKLNDNSVREIICRAKAGEKQRTIASMFGIRQQSVSKIVNGKQWAHLRDH